MSAEALQSFRAAGSPRAARLIVDPPLPGAVNMASDVALARTAARTGVITIRFYRWAPACLSFGRNQPAADRYDPARLAALGLDVVRRPTGGRAVLHDDEVTYAVAFPGRALGGARSAFLTLHAAVAHGLRALGVNAVLLDGDRAHSESEASAGACFARPAPGEIVVDGDKVVGSAQARIGGALLQHGSILLSGSQQPAAEPVIRRALPDGWAPDFRGAGVPPSVASRQLRSADPAPPITAATLAECLGVRPRWEDVVRALTRAFGLVLGVALVAGALDADERALVSKEAAFFRDPAWTWRR